MRDQTQLLSLRELRYDAMPHALILPGEAYRKEARKAAGWQIDQIAGGPARRRSAGSRNCPRICPLMSHVRVPSIVHEHYADFGPYLGGQEAARAAWQPKNLHRQLSPGDDLTDVFAWREERTVSNSLTLQYDKVVILLEPNAITRELCRRRVTVVDYPDGRLAIRYRGLDLPTCPTPPSTNCGRFRRPPSSRTSTSAPSSRIFASGSSSALRLAARRRRAAKGKSATCSKSAEPGPAAAFARRSQFHHQLNELLSSSSTPQALFVTFLLSRAPVGQSL